jgi:transposase
MAIVFVGIDLAKNIFAVHAVDEHGRVAFKDARVARDKLVGVIAALAPCTIGMEACGGAHEWARRFVLYGHTVKLMAAKLVAPYRMSGKRGKNDAADAAAVCEALQRPNMRFVPVKTVEQQAHLCLHRTRQGFVGQRTETINRIRGQLAEFGIALSLKAKTVRREVALHLEDLPGHANLAIGDLLSELHHLDERIAEYDRRIAQLAREDARARQLMRLRGIAELSATALVATVGNGHDFQSGRQFAAWIGLVPGQYSSGGKSRLGKITKAGDSYLRHLLVMGARSVLQAAKAAKAKGAPLDGMARWALALEARSGYLKTLVAIAAKNARLAWACLHRGEAFELPR